MERLKKASYLYSILLVDIETGVKSLETWKNKMKNDDYKQLQVLHKKSKERAFDMLLDIHSLLQ